MGGKVELWRKVFVEKISLEPRVEGRSTVPHMSLRPR